MQESTGTKNVVPTFFPRVTRFRALDFLHHELLFLPVGNSHLDTLCGEQTIRQGLLGTLIVQRTRGFRNSRLFGDVAFLQGFTWTAGGTV